MTAAKEEVSTTRRTRDDSPAHESRTLSVPRSAGLTSCAHGSVTRLSIQKGDAVWKHTSVPARALSNEPGMSRSHPGTIFKAPSSPSASSGASLSGLSLRTAATTVAVEQQPLDEVQRDEAARSRDADRRAQRQRVGTCRSASATPGG